MQHHPGECGFLFSFPEGGGQPQNPYRTGQDPAGFTLLCTLNPVPEGVGACPVVEGNSCVFGQPGTWVLPLEVLAEERLANLLDANHHRPWLEPGESG